MDDPDLSHEPPRRLPLVPLLLILAVLAAVPIAGALLHVDSPPSPPPHERPNPLSDAEGRVYDTDFSSPADGFALWGRCLRAGDPECRTTLLITTSFAGVWESRPIAIDGSPVDLTGHTYALGRCRVALVTRADFRLFSADCGRTWTRVPLAPEGTVDVIPRDGLLESPCYQQRHYVAGCADRRLLLTLPDSGRRSWLSTAAPLEKPRAERVPAEDGAWWISGTHPATGGPGLAVSRDGGRQWSVSALPRPKGVPFDQDRQFMRLSVTTFGENVYATGIGRHGGHDSALLAVFHSGDAGRTWRQTWRSDGRTQPQAIGGVVIAAQGNLLVVVTEDGDRRYRSVDGARTFQRGATSEQIIWPRWTRGGYLARSANDPWRWYHSRSGTYWLRLFPG